MSIETQSKITTFASTQCDIDAVISAGADHIILEDPNYSIRAVLREKEQTPPLLEILVAHIKQYPDIKISISMDIVLHHQDIPSIKRYLNSIKNLDIDYIRIQDVGLISLIQEITPNIRIVFISETGPHNTEGIRLLHEQGIDIHQFNNETPYSEIKKICHKINSHWSIQIHGHILIQHSHRRLLYDKGSGSTQVRKLAMDHDFPDRYYTFHDTIHGCFMYAHFERCLVDQIVRLKKLNLDNWLIDLRGEDREYLIKTIQTYRQLRDTPNKLNEDTLKNKNEQLEEYAKKPLKAGFFVANQTDIDWRNKKWDRLESISILGHIVDIKKKQFITIEPREEIYTTDSLSILTPEQNEIHIKDSQVYNIENTPIQNSNGHTFIKLRWQKGVSSGSLLIRRIQN